MIVPHVVDFDLHPNDLLVLVGVEAQSAGVAVAASAEAAGPTRGYQIVNNNYVSNNNYHPGSVRGGYYGGGSPYYHNGYGRSRMETHDSAVRRIKATHSRFRTTYHPRSFYNSPPHPYDYRGW